MHCQIPATLQNSLSRDTHLQEVHRRLWLDHHLIDAREKVHGTVRSHQQLPRLSAEEVQGTLYLEVITEDVMAILMHYMTIYHLHLITTI